MKNFFSTILILTIGFSAFSKDWKVKVRLINDTNDDITIYIKQSDQMNSSQTVLLRLKLNNDGQKDTIIDVKQYSILNCYATLKKGGKTDVSTMLINDKNLIFSPELTLPKDLTNDNKPSITDFTTSPTLLEFNPSNFMNKTNSPKPVSELFNQYLGGLAICVNKNGKDSIIDRIPPYDLGSEMQQYFNSVEDKKELYFINQTDQKVKAAIPGIVQLQVNFDYEKMYHLKIVYKGVGEIGWKDEKHVDINKNFVEKLGLQTHYKLAKYKIKYGDDLRVYQINKAFCFEGIYYELTEMKKIDENHTMNASVYFFNEGNYVNENKSTIERTIGSEFVGYWSENPIIFTELLDFSLSAYYNQQKNILSTLPEEDVVKRYKEMFKSDSITKGLTKSNILSFLNSYVSSYKTSNPDKAQSLLLKTEPVVINQDINTWSPSEVNFQYELLNKEVELTLPKEVSIEMKKKYLTIMNVDKEL